MCCAFSLIRDFTCPTTSKEGKPRFLLGGIQNVSRWMTWLPISVKNAAKCDKWYVLQNHSITESLNANGAREKVLMTHPRACRISVSKNKSKPKLTWWLGWNFSKLLPNHIGQAIRGSWRFPHHGKIESVQAKWHSLRGEFSPALRLPQICVYGFKPKTNQCDLFFKKSLLPANIGEKTIKSKPLTWVRQGYPPNLSILLSGGKENNRDSPS